MFYVDWVRRDCWEREIIEVKGRFDWYAFSSLLGEFIGLILLMFVIIGLGIGEVYNGFIVLTGNNDPNPVLLITVLLLLTDLKVYGLSYNPSNILLFCYLSLINKLSISRIYK